MKTSDASCTVIPYESLSHHLRSPLASLQALLLLLERTAAGSDSGTIEKLHEKISLLTRRIDQVTEYLRLQQNPECTYSFFRVGDLIREVSGQKDIQIRGSVDSEIMADRVLVRDLLLGILGVFSKNVSVTVTESPEKPEILVHCMGSAYEENGSSEHSVENSLLYAIAMLALEHLGGSVVERPIKKGREINVLLPKSMKKK